MHEDFKRLWTHLLTDAAYLLFAFMFIGALGAVWYILVAYWLYLSIFAAGFSLWLIAGRASACDVLVLLDAIFGGRLAGSCGHSWKGQSPVLRSC